MSWFLKNKKGFTLIEIIAVLIIIGILGAVIVSRATSPNNELFAQTEVIKGHLRYTQERSMNTNAVWYLQFSGNTYTLYRAGTAQTLPGESGTVVTPGVTLAWTGGTNIFSFDGHGRPCTDATAATLLTTARTVTLTHNSDSAVITVTPNTGFIP